LVRLCIPLDGGRVLRLGFCHPRLWHRGRHAHGVRYSRRLGRLALLICPPRWPDSPEPSWYCDQALAFRICHLPFAIWTLESTWPRDPAPNPQSLIHDVARLPPSQADSRLGHSFLAVCPQSAATL